MCAIWSGEMMSPAQLGIQASTLHVIVSVVYRSITTWVRFWEENLLSHFTLKMDVRLSDDTRVDSMSISVGIYVPFPQLSSGVTRIVIGGYIYEVG